MTSTQIKKLNAYPEWNSLPAYIQVIHQFIYRLKVWQPGRGEITTKDSLFHIVHRSYHKGYSFRVRNKNCEMPHKSLKN